MIGFNTSDYIVDPDSSRWFLQDEGEASGRSYDGLGDGAYDAASTCKSAKFSGGGLASLTLASVNSL